MDIAAAMETLLRGSVECHTREELKRKLFLGRPLRVKLGVDPTSADLHLGHTVVLSSLRGFQDLGHTAVLIIGDFTARVGDPSGRDATRPTLSPEAIGLHAKTYQEQAFKVLDPAKTELRFNSEWLEPFVRTNLFSVLQRYTVSQLLQREDFAARTAKSLPITLLEILYPILQGYDSVAIRADVELGGNDQLFNLLMGRQMQKDADLEPQVALTYPLLVGTDGARKMSKSYGNVVAINDPARDMFGKLMKISDELMLSYYELLTREEMSRVRAMHPMEAKKALAESLTARFHGSAAAQAERAYFDSTFSKKQIPELDVIPVSIGESKAWSQLLVQIGAAPSRKEAQRLIAQGAFKIEGSAVKDDKIPMEGGVRDAKTVSVQVGKYKFYKLRIEP